MLTPLLLAPFPSRVENVEHDTLQKSILVQYLHHNRQIQIPSFIAVLSLTKITEYRDMEPGPEQRVRIKSIPLLYTINLGLPASMMKILS